MQHTVQDAGWQWQYGSPDGTYTVHSASTHSTQYTHTECRQHAHNTRYGHNAIHTAHTDAADDDYGAHGIAEAIVGGAHQRATLDRDIRAAAADGRRAANGTADGEVNGQGR